MFMKLSHIINKMFTNILVYKTSFYNIGKCVKTLFKVSLRYPAGCTLFFTGISIEPARRPETEYFFSWPNKKSEQDKKNLHLANIT